MAPPSEPQPERYLRHFRDPRRVGRLVDANALAQATHPACGDHGQLFLRIDEEAVTDARFQCRGCSAAIGSLSILTDWLPGQSLDGISGLSLEDLSDIIGPLPRLKQHALRLAHQLLQAVVEDYRQRAS